jgi:Protein of unknown function (DUF1383)
MNQLQRRLFRDKSVPYLCKKDVNDRLTEQVMKRMDTAFFAAVLDAVVQAPRLYVVKGGGAICAHTKLAASLSDLDLETYLSDFGGGATDVKAAMCLPNMKAQITAVCQQYSDAVSRALAEITEESVGLHRSAVVFKSYVNEAIQLGDFGPVKFVLQNDVPIKTTMSMVNDEYYLLRFSYTVHAVYDGKMRLFKGNRRGSVPINHMQLDLYFLDVSIKRSVPNRLCLRTLFGRVVYVERAEFVVADQLECLLYNVFHKQLDKAHARFERLQNFLARVRHETDDDEFEGKLAAYRRHASSPCMFRVYHVKKLLYECGCRLGARLVAQLYFDKRFYTSRRDVTHQINFPHHVRDRKFYSWAWKHYLNMLNDLYDLKIKIK